MRAAEEAAFARGITAEELMNEAAAGIARSVRQFFERPGRCLVFGGKGNNAGDAFATGEILHLAGWTVEVRLAFAEEELGELARKKLVSLRQAQAAEASRTAARAEERPPVVLDGLLGLGAKPPLREPIRSACREINRLRRETNAFVFAVDLPTGLDGDSGEADADCVVADFTVTIGAAKRGLLADSALDFVGRFAVIRLEELRFGDSLSDGIAATAEALRSLLPRRKFSTYKNQCGRIGIVAGSKGFTGAAVLCSVGALRAGAGLVELFVPEEIYDISAASAPSEVMVKAVRSYESLLDEPIDVWALGPGLGRAHAPEIRRLIERARQ